MDKSDVVEKLLDKLFHRGSSLKVPVFIDSPSPSSDAPFVDFKTRLETRRQSTRLMLMKYDVEFLEAALNLPDVAVDKMNSQAIEKIYHLKIIEEKIRLPDWFSGGFGVEGYQANFKYWAQIERWSLEECIAVSIGFEPDSVFNMIAKSPMITNEVHKFFQKRQKLIKAKYFDYHYSNNILLPSPLKFCEWAYSIKLDVPSQLFDAVSDITGIQFTPY